MSVINCFVGEALGVKSFGMKFFFLVCFYALDQIPNINISVRL